MPTYGGASSFCKFNKSLDLFKSVVVHHLNTPPAAIFWHGGVFDQVH